MEFLTDMITNVPEGTDEATVEDTKTREAARAEELARQGHLLRLWKPPAKPGEWRTFGLFPRGRRTTPSRNSGQPAAACVDDRRSHPLDTAPQRPGHQGLAVPARAAESARVTPHFLCPVRTS